MIEKIGESNYSNSKIITDGVINNDILNLLEFSFKFLSEHKKELINKFGGKGYGLLLVESLKEKLGFRIPTFELISTDFADNVLFGGNQEINEGINFTEKQEKYLKEVFNDFKNSEFLAIRSSATTEDSGKSNMPGVFYTGFCGKDFNHFLNEVKKVILSAKNGGENTKMGIVIMDVVGNYKHGTEVYKSIDRFTGQISVENTYNNLELYYPDGGGVMMTSNPYDSSVLEVHGVQGLPTTVTGYLAQGVKVVLGKNSLESKLNIVGVENTPGNYAIYKQLLTAGLDNSSTTINLQKFHSTSHYILDKNKYGVIGYNNEVPFEEETYFQLLSLGKLLEKIYGFALDIEFVINDGKIYIIQIRKINGVQKRPENMQEPDLEGKEIILDSKNITSSFGFINNETYDIIYGGNGSGESISKVRREMDILLIIKKLENISKKPYFAIFSNLQDLPVIDRSNFPNLKGLIIYGSCFKGLGTHVIMRIIESGIPMIFIDDNITKRKNIENAIIYIDGSNKALIYKNK